MFQVRWSVLSATRSIVFQVVWPTWRADTESVVAPVVRPSHRSLGLCGEFDGWLIRAESRPWLRFCLSKRLIASGICNLSFVDNRDSRASATMPRYGHKPGVFEGRQPPIACLPIDAEPPQQSWRSRQAFPAFRQPGLIPQGQGHGQRLPGHACSRSQPV